MARGQAELNIRNDRRRPPILNDQGEYSESALCVVTDSWKGSGLRASRNSNPCAKAHVYEHSDGLTNHHYPKLTPFRNDKHLSPLRQATAPRAENADLIEVPPQVLHQPSTSSRKRKRGQEEQEMPPFKQARISPPSFPAEGGLKEEKEKKERASDINEEDTNPLEYWTLTKRWPEKYFAQDSHTREEELEQDSWLEEQMDNSTQVVKYVETSGWRLPCPIKKVPTSLRRKQSDSSLNSSNDQKNRESKSVPYRNTRYTTLRDMENLCQTLLKEEQSVPQDSLFRKDIFKKTCRKIEDRNEARVIQDIARLIVPSAETLVTYGATHLDHLIEGINEGWTASIPVEDPRPQPDYSVGFSRSAFTDEQLKKLAPLIGSVFDNSFFAATYRMYFPFLTCKVKCGAAALDIADRQNAHSMTVAIRALVELFRCVKREKELDREILAFSISHDHRSVRIYGHYPIIDDRDKTTFYRHPIHMFDFTALDGRDKWTAYKFAKNIYDTWMPILHKRICSAIDNLPADINFDLSQSASFTQSTPQSSQQSNAVSVLGEDDSQSGPVASHDVTPTTSFTQATERASKKRATRKRG
ncbi:MAG: hypothetical protein Q9181_006403 [Wetmoreana brouardii]